LFQTNKTRHDYQTQAITTRQEHNAILQHFHMRYYNISTCLNSWQGAFTKRNQNERTRSEMAIQTPQQQTKVLMEPGPHPTWRSPALLVRMEHPLWDIASTTSMAVHVCLDGVGRLWLQMATPSGRTWITPGSDQTWWSYNVERQWIQYVPSSSSSEHP
jgi:hypothetical protein